jgi:hypothetical protein
MSLRVAGTGEMSPVDGVAEKSEVCAKFCALAANGTTANAASRAASHSRSSQAAVAAVLFMTRLFSAEITAISSRASWLFVTRLTLW